MSDIYIVLSPPCSGRNTIIKQLAESIKISVSLKESKIDLFGNSNTICLLNESKTTKQNNFLEENVVLEENDKKILVLINSNEIIKYQSLKNTNLSDENISKAYSNISESLYHQFDKISEMKEFRELSDYSKLQTWDEKTLETLLDKNSDSFDVIFLTIDCFKNPIEQLHFIYEIFKKRKFELSRIVSIVNCYLASNFTDTIKWFESCIHFSDVVILNKTKHLQKNWVENYIKHFEKECYPCIFQATDQKEIIPNPSLVLGKQARRLSLAFDLQESTNDEFSEKKSDVFEFDQEVFNDDYFDSDESAFQEDLKKSDKLEIEDDSEEIDPYFEKRADGSFKKIIPDILPFFSMKELDCFF